MHIDQRFVVDGRAVRSRVWAGGGTPVVLVHGYMLASWSMVPLGESLALRHHVVAPDLPGFGESERPREALGVDALADAVLGVLDGADLERVALLGHSFGSQIVASLAHRHPARISHLVLVSPVIDPAQRTTRTMVLGGVREAATEPWSYQWRLARDYLRAGWRPARETLEHLRRERIEDRLPHLDMPTLVVRGERDPFVSAEWAQRVVELLPNGHLELLEGSTHAPVYADAMRLAEVVERFLG